MGEIRGIRNSLGIRLETATCLESAGEPPHGDIDYKILKAAQIFCAVFCWRGCFWKGEC